MMKKTERLIEEAVESLERTELHILQSIWQLEAQIEALGSKIEELRKRIDEPPVSQ